MMSHFHRIIPANAPTLTTTANQSTVRGAGKITCNPNHTARFKITPTTAAVTADSAVVNLTFPRNCSMCGAPRKIHKKHGTNVVHVVISAPSVAAGGGDAGGADDNVDDVCAVLLVDFPGRAAHRAVARECEVDDGAVGGDGGGGGGDFKSGGVVWVARSFSGAADGGLGCGGGKRGGVRGNDAMEMGHHPGGAGGGRAGIDLQAGVLEEVGRCLGTRALRGGGSARRLCFAESGREVAGGD